MSQNRNITYFYPFTSNKNEGNIEKFYKILRNEIPAENLPIGASDIGEILMSFSSESHGKIYFWDSNKENDTKVYCIATSFSDLISKLKPFNDDSVKIDKNGVSDVWIDPSFEKELKKYH